MYDFDLKETAGVKERRTFVFTVAVANRNKVLRGTFPQQFLLVFAIYGRNEILVTTARWDRRAS